MTQTNCPKCNEYICDCTCDDVTGYSQKRRLLREHRKTMRVMQGIIREHGLHGEYSEALQSDVDLAQDWWPGPEYEYPEDASDSEDPEKKARDDLEEYKREVADKETLFQIAVIETARESVEYKQVHLEEREDLRGQILRTKLEVGGASSLKNETAARCVRTEVQISAAWLVA